MNDTRSPERMSQRKALLILGAVLVVLALLAGSCAGGDDTETEAQPPAETEAPAATSGTPTDPGESAFSTREQAQRIYDQRVRSAGIVPNLMPEPVAGEAGARICVNLYDGRAPVELGQELMSQYGLNQEQAGTMLGAAAASFCENRTPTEENFLTGTPPE